MVRVFNRFIDNENKDESKKEMVVDLIYNQTNNTLINRITGSELNFDGKFINGQLEDKQLNRLPMDQGFWFEWVAFHPETEVFLQINNYKHYI